MIRNQKTRMLNQAKKTGYPTAMKRQCIYRLEQSVMQRWRPIPMFIGAAVTTP